MPQEDPIADLIARIKNAHHRGHEELDLPTSNTKVSIAQVLKEEGYIEDFDVTEENSRGTLSLQLRYKDSSGVIEDIKRVSKPSRRVYASKDEIPSVLGGLGTVLLTTSEGIMT
ncbi:MAG: 30S ribosomal protein S8, partial [Candidatus Bipolaricaulota bacterium]